MANNNNFQHFLKLLVHQQPILIDLQYVEIVLPLPKLSGTINGHPALMGLLNYHGQKLPVYSLAKLMKVSEDPITLDTPLILCSINQTKFALLVSEVIETIMLQKNDIQKSDFFQSQDYIIGITKNNLGDWWILDLLQLFKKERDLDAINLDCQ